MSINEIITEYLSEKEKKSAAEKRMETLKSMILDYAKDTDNFTTDIYTVIVKTQISTRIDTKALCADFPDAKDVYGKPVISKIVNAVVTAAAGKKSA